MILKKLKECISGCKSNEDSIKRSLELPSAKIALERTKEPQLRNCIRSIQDAVDCGKTRTYIENGEKLHAETIKYLTDKGYNVKVSCFKENNDRLLRRERDEYFNEAYWGEDANGQYEYEEC